MFSSHTRSELLFFLPGTTTLRCTHVEELYGVPICIPSGAFSWNLTNKYGGGCTFHHLQPLPPWKVGNLAERFVLET